MINLKYDKIIDYDDYVFLMRNNIKIVNFYKDFI